MTEYYIGKKFYFNPDDEVSMKYYEGTANYCNENNATIVELEPEETEVHYNKNGKETTETITCRMFQIQTIPEPTEEEKKQSEISQLKVYLASTDYVVTKLNELKLEDDSEYEVAKEKYSDILTKRKEARARINELEVELNDNNESSD